MRFVSRFEHKPLRMLRVHHELLVALGGGSLVSSECVMTDPISSVADSSVAFARCADISVPVEDYGEKAKAAGLSNAQAAEILRGMNSGMVPNLSRHGYRMVKRAFDICASGVAIAILLIPGAVLSAVICIKSPGAGPLYSQLRVGRLKKDGSFKLFRMWKFRSMVPHADEMLKELEGRNEADGPLFKIKDDPRIISGVGKFIRKHSIDELPQLINVFMGDMSLIGPRPGLPKEALQYSERAKRRLTVKPGCGGPWQSGGRSDSTFEGMIDYDLEYVDKCSPAYDLILIFGTIRAMLHGEGAY